MSGATDSSSSSSSSNYYCGSKEQQCAEKEVEDSKRHQQQPPTTGGACCLLFPDGTTSKQVVHHRRKIDNTGPSSVNGSDAALDETALQQDHRQQQQQLHNKSSSSGSRNSELGGVVVDDDEAPASADSNNNDNTMEEGGGGTDWRRKRVDAATSHRSAGSFDRVALSRAQEWLHATDAAERNSVGCCDDEECHAEEEVKEEEVEGKTHWQDRTAQPMHKKRIDPISLLERLSEDVCARILVYLHLPEIVSAALVSRSLWHLSRSDAVWRRLFRNRWRCTTAAEGDDIGDCCSWYRAYQTAHSNPHDLWITHWNCAYPTDCLAPGRTCIRGRPGTILGASDGDDNDTNEERRRPCAAKKDAKRCRNDDDGAALRCPQCRHHHRAAGEGVQTRQDARRAFRAASTQHRTIHADQYETGTLSAFASDLVFFNLTDPATETGQWELQQLLKELHLDPAPSVLTAAAGDDLIADPTLYETSHHSWHIVKFANPDFDRPIVYSIGIQRSDCFSVYPSEGYLEPGGSAYVTFGVRNRGSAIAYAVEAFDIFRDGLSCEWSCFRTEEAMLPVAPFLVRYHFVQRQPIGAVDLSFHHESERPATMTRPESAPSLSVSSLRSKRRALVEYYRKQGIPSHHVRSIYLSAHVNAHYTFTDFAAATCSPWDLQRDDPSGPIYCSPILREEHPVIYNQLQNTHSRLPSESDQILRAHTDGPCSCCKRKWGSRAEELMQAYSIADLSNTVNQKKRRVLLRNIVRCLRLQLENEELTGHSKNLSSLFYVMTSVLQTGRSSERSSRRLVSVCLDLETVLDRLYARIPVGGVEYIPWRKSGVYQNGHCTHSDFIGQTNDIGPSSDHAEWENESCSGDSFPHLSNWVSKFGIRGRADPNHVEKSLVVISSGHGKFGAGFQSDVFMDNPVSAFQAGICMISEPRTRVLHGVYDMIPYPGSIVRRPKINLDQGAVQPIDSATLLSNKNLAYLWLQDGLDFRNIVKANYLGYPSACNLSIAANFSLHNFLHNIPPPGVGRYPLSLESTVSSEKDNRIIELEINARAKGVLPRNEEDELRRDDTLFGPPPLFINRADIARPPRFIQLLWLLGSQLGLTVPDVQVSCQVYIDRRLLISAQWFCISLMAAPLFCTLLARYMHYIPTEPFSFNIDDDHHSYARDMRYLRDKECGRTALLLLFLWLRIGRWGERFTGRDFFRTMAEHIVPPDQRTVRLSFFQCFYERLKARYQRRWDTLCPIFLQRYIYAPPWNLRTRNDVAKHVAYWKGRNLPEQQESFHARTITNTENTLFGDSRDEGLHLTAMKPANKLLLGFVVAFGSFCACSPHIWLNLATVIPCSIGLGMSMSLHSLEKGSLDGAVANNNNTGSMLKSFNVVTLAIFCFLAGQLVGSSGGTLFLAEFVVTSVSLLLGGAGTVSANAMESWGCFFCLSLSAFFGYLLGRVALLDGIRHRRACRSSLLLSRAIIFLFVLWFLIIFCVRWEIPLDVLVVQPRGSGQRNVGSLWSQERIIRKIQ
jgi:hypothetical protein